MRLLLALAATSAIASASTACSGNLFRASRENGVDTVLVGSLIGTPLSIPSGYSIASRRPVRTDSTANFDFAYTILPDGRRVFLPLATLGLGPGLSVLPGFQASTDAFDDIRRAPSNGYLTRDTIALAEGQRYIIRSSILPCANFGVPQYGKIEIIDFDDVARLVRFKVLVNNNCGFLSLEPGIPEN